MMTCLIIYRKPGLRTPTNISILFLSVSDILMAVLIMPFSLASSIKGNGYFPKDFVPSVHGLFKHYSG